MPLESKVAKGAVAIAGTETLKIIPAEEVEAVITLQM